MARRLVPQLLHSTGANLAETGLDPGPLPHHGLCWRPGVPVTPTPHTPVSHGEPSPWLHHPAVVELLRVLRETPVADKGTRESLKLSPHRVPTILSQQGFSEVRDCGRGGRCFLRCCTMDSRFRGNDGEGCRNDGEGAGNDGLALWSPYPKWGSREPPPQPYGKGWTARMVGYRRTLSTALPQRHTRPWGLSPAPLSETVTKALFQRFSTCYGGNLPRLSQ